MNGIELKVSIAAGAVGGVLLILAELVLMHRKVMQYRNHLRNLHRSGRRLRLYAETICVAALALVQPVLISLLIVMALGSFNPAFSDNAAHQLQGQTDGRHLRSEHTH